MLKFRTMVANAAAIGPGITYRGDPRITRLGRALRATKLDELPQLINVLRGEMTLVGPRPESPDYVAQYPHERMPVVEDVTPGVVGVAQLVFRAEEYALGREVHREYVEMVLPRKLAIDHAYLRRRGLATDLAVLTLFLAVLLGYPAPRYRRPAD